MMIASMIPAVSNVLGSGGALGGDGALESAADTTTIAPRIDLEQNVGSGSMIQGDSGVPVWAIVAGAVVALVFVFKKK